MYGTPIQAIMARQTFTVDVDDEKVTIPKGTIGCIVNDGTLLEDHFLAFFFGDSAFDLYPLSPYSIDVIEVHPNLLPSKQRLQMKFGSNYHTSYELIKPPEEHSCPFCDLQAQTFIDFNMWGTVQQVPVCHAHGQKIGYSLMCDSIPKKDNEPHHQYDFEFH